MSELNLLHSDVEDKLRASVRDLLVDRCPASAVISTYDGDRSLVAPLWKALAADLGLAGLLVPEELGGAEASVREAAVVLEELGRAVAPVPFLTSSVVATTALLAAERGGPADDLVAALAAGERTAALLLPFSTGPGAEASDVSIDAGGRLTGRVSSVAGVLDADLLLAPVTTSDGLAVYAVPVTDVRVTPVTSFDMTRQLADASFEAVAGELVLPTAVGFEAVRRALEVGAALLASEQVGLAQWCLATTVAYLKERQQFGRVVGGFEAHKQGLADLYIAGESAAAAARYAAAAVAEDDSDGSAAAAAIAMAQAWCGGVAVRAAEDAIELHGEMGMTWEHPAHLYLKRAKANQTLFGTPGFHRDRLAGLGQFSAHSAR